ncbi:MAG TPA: hypothetical protein VF331_09425 [Polyangiales bacterium]
MSSASARFAQAGQATFLVHLAKTMCALAPALAASGTPRLPAATPHALALVHGLLDLAGTPPSAAGLGYLASAFAWLVLTPLLSQLWLSAMTSAAPLGEHARRSAARYGPALGLAIAGVGFPCVLLAVGVVACTGVQAALAFTHDERLRDLCAGAASLPFIALGLYGLTFHDVASARLALGSPGLRPSLVAGLHFTTLRHVVTRSTIGACTLLLAALGLLLPRLWLGASDSAVLVCGQCIALAVTLLRARWLAGLVARLSRDIRSSTAG